MSAKATAKIVKQAKQAKTAKKHRGSFSLMQLETIDDENEGVHQRCNQHGVPRSQGAWNESVECADVNGADHESGARTDRVTDAGKRDDSNSNKSLKDEFDPTDADDLKRNRNGTTFSQSPSSGSRMQE